MQIERAKEIGFCFGVKRAIAMLEEAAEAGQHIDTLGAIVHNQQVLQKLSEKGIRVAAGIDDIQGKIAAISAHGVSPVVKHELTRRGLKVIDTTCPFVHRAQLAARSLVREKYFVVVYGDTRHPEVRGILGWAENKGLATLDITPVSVLKPIPHRIGILSQTTQVPAQFMKFVKEVMDVTFTKGSDLRIIDTICHGIRSRQEEAYALAQRVDVMLVIGSRTSANTTHLAELCGGVTDTHLVEAVSELKSRWFKKSQKIGVTAGTSTSEDTVAEIIAALEALVGN